MAKETTRKVYSKVPAQSVFQAILCGVEEMPGQKCPSVWVVISSTPHKMAWKCIPKLMPNYQVILCEVEEMPGQKRPSVWVGHSSTPHKMAWNTLWHRLWNTLFSVCSLFDT